jgi:hypothetical protein
MTITDESASDFLVNVQLASGPLTITLPTNLIHKTKNGIYKARLSDTTKIMS